MHARQISSHRSSALAARAAQMRSRPTLSERTLWAALRARKLGISFRRQVQLGEYIADFVAPTARVVVEVDGPLHLARARADARRDRELGRLGYRVVRLEAQLVMRDLERAVAAIREALEGRG